MTRIAKHSTVGEQGRVYSRRPHTEARDPVRAAPPAPVAGQTSADPGDAAGLDGPPGRGVGELLLAQFGPVYVAGADHRLIYATDAFVDFARDAWGFAVDPARATPAPPPLRSVLEALAETGHFEPSETEVRRAGTTRRYLGRHFVAERDGGRVYYGYFEDITRATTLERKLGQTAEKMNDIIRASSDWVWETDADLRLTEVSPRIAAITGVPPHLHLGKHVLSLGELPESSVGTPDLETLFANRRSFRNRLFLMHDEAGEPRRIHLSGMPFFDKANGRFLGFRGTGTDVTRTLEAERAAIDARKDLEEALNTLELRNDQLSKTLAKAQAASNAKTEFLALTSHELRTPLNAIIGFTELCRRRVAGPVSERMADYLDNVLAASGHLVQIIDNLLDTVRIENESVDINLQQLNVAKLLRDTVTMIEVRAQQSGITLHVPDVDDGIDVLADTTATRQILINLLTNAIKFTPRGGEVGVDVATAPDDTIAIAVWDTGIGIPEDRQQAVFERFQQVRSDAFTSHAEGVGIGLHVARNLAQLMGGDIALESELGTGSRFTLTLRRWDAAPAQP